MLAGDKISRPYTGFARNATISWTATILNTGAIRRPSSVKSNNGNKCVSYTKENNHVNEKRRAANFVTREATIVI
jgi:hypothetical protein